MNKQEESSDPSSSTSLGQKIAHLFREWRRPEPSLRELMEEEEQSQEPSFTAEERTLFANIRKLRNKSIEGVKVPQAHIVAAEVTDSLSDLLERMLVNWHSRIPVYREHLDEVIGVVHIKDVVAELHSPKPRPLSELVREVRFEAPSMPVLDLLFDMLQSRQYIALVVDEFGGVDGLVTIEDLVEEIVGEIQDEHDSPLPSIVEHGDGSLVIDGRLAPEDFEARLGCVLTDYERERETMAGVIFALAGRIPPRGELLLHPSGLEFEILESDSRIIRSLRVRGAK